MEAPVSVIYYYFLSYIISLYNYHLGFRFCAFDYGYQVVISQFDIHAVLPCVEVSAVKLGDLNIVLLWSMIHLDLFYRLERAWAHNLLNK